MRARVVLSRDDNKGPYVLVYSLHAHVFIANLTAKPIPSKVSFLFLLKTNVNKCKQWLVNLIEDEM